ncbi:MAG: DUF1553 domain-containing protein, partial [Planctomycetota bacterium]
LQALSLLNSNFVLRMADRFAERLQKDAGADPVRQLRRAYELAYGRQPSDEEVALLRPAVQTQGLAAVCRAIFNTSEFLFVE